MDPDQYKSQLPATSDSVPAQRQSEADIQSPLGFLPRTDTIQIDEKIDIARNEGFNPLAIELAIGSYETSASYKLLLFSLAVIAAALVAFLFPVDRFFKPKTRELGTMTIGEPIREDNPALFMASHKPWLKVLLEMDRLYFQEGKLTEAIQVAESNLQRVPEKNWESWKKVYYRYWELLSDAGKTIALKTATNSYLQKMPEDPFANYYSAQAFLAAVEAIRAFNHPARQNYRHGAETLIQQIDHACNAINAQRKVAASKEQKVYLEGLYQKLRLQQAKLFVLIWRLGGYEEDRHPDVVYRDKALDICDSDELAQLKEAKALKIEIYNHILDRWYWFEGQQVIQGTRQKRRAIAEELRQLQKELEAEKKL
jgi:soluble cytochrome b562